MIRSLLKKTVICFLLQTAHLYCQNLSREQRILNEEYLNIIRRLNDPQKTLALTDKILTTDSTNTQALAYRALTHVDLMNSRAAISDFELYMTYKPNSRFCIHRGKLRVQLGDTLGGLRDFDKAMQFSGNAPEIFDEILLVLKIERYAVPYTEQMLKSHPNTLLGHIFLGSIALKKDLNTAIEKYRTAYTILMNQPFLDWRIDYRWFFEVKADIEYKQKNYTKAIEAINQSILLHPERPILYADRINYYMATGNQDRACEDFFRLISSGENYSFKFSLNCEMKNINKTRMEQWNKHVTAEKLYMEGYSMRGDDSVKIKTAVAFYSKALAIKPDHIYSRANRASYYLLLHQPDRALKDLDTLIRINPKSASAYHYKAEANRLLHNYKQAILDEGNAIRFDSTNAQYWVKRAALETDFGDTLKAISDLSKAIQLNSYYSRAYLERGVLEYYAQKNYNKALKDFLSAIELEEDKPLDRVPSYYYYFCAQAYDKLSLYSESLGMIEKAIALEPKNNSYYYFCGEVKARIKDMRGACEDWHLAKKLGYRSAEQIILYNCNDH